VQGTHEASQVGEEFMQGQFDVLTLLPQVVGHIFEGARCNDEDRLFYSKRLDLLNSITKQYGVRLLNDLEAALNQLSQDRFVGQQIIWIAGQTDEYGRKR
jgi:hypothetical protein